MKIVGSFDEFLSPRIEIRIAKKKISLVVDTGFNGELMLPQTMLKDFGFTYSMKSEAELADGSIVETTIYSGKIKWFGKERTGKRSLILLHTTNIWGSSVAKPAAEAALAPSPGAGV